MPSWIKRLSSRERKTSHQRSAIWVVRSTVVLGRYPPTSGAGGGRKSGPTAQPPNMVIASPNVTRAVLRPEIRGAGSVVAAPRQNAKSRAPTPDAPQPVRRRQDAWRIAFVMACVVARVMPRASCRHPRKSNQIKRLNAAYERLAQRIGDFPPSRLL